MDNLFRFNGDIRSITVETALVLKTGFSWKEGTREFVGREIFSKSGLLKEKQSPRETEIYTYTQGKRIHTVQTFNKEKELLKTKTSSFDTKNRLVKEEWLSPEKEIAETVIYEYDVKNNITAKQEKNRLTLFKYSEEGQLLCEYTYLGKEPELIIIYKYENGFLTVKEYRDPEEKRQRTEMFSYNDLGDLITYRCMNSEDIIINHNIYEYHHYHHGNWLKRIKYAVSEDSRKIKEIPVEVIYRSINYFEENKETEQTAPKKDKIEFPNGIYAGDTLNGLMHGQGIFEYNDGSRYEGEFKNGIIDGVGTMLYADGRTYTGEFKDGRMEGQGTCRWPGGDIYKGEFHKGMMHGIGTFTWKNGDRFRGLFAKNKRTDQGLIETGEKR